MTTRRSLPIVPLLAAIGILLAAASAHAQAACDARFRTAADIRLGAYDPFDHSPVEEELRLEIARDGAGPCAARIVFFSNDIGPGRRLSGATEEIGYGIFESASSTRPLESVGEPTEDDALSFVFGEDEAEETVAAVLVVEPGQVVEAGDYAGRVEARLFTAEEGGRFRLVDRALVDVVATVEPTAAVNLALRADGFSAGRSHAELDLGELSDGATGEVYVQVRTTTGYRLLLRSTHGGALMRDGALSDDGWIAYEATLDGRRLDLPRGVEAEGASGTRSANVRGDAHRLHVAVAPVRDRRPGDYTDEIRIRIDMLR